MARLSPSPSGSSRRLSELLVEQQEPFCLELYLLEKGCSPSLLNAAGGGATSTCWPRRSSAAPALRRAAASNKTRASGLLRLLLSKILRGTAAAAAAKKKLQQPVAIDWGAVDGERWKSPGQFENAAPLWPSIRRVDGAVEADIEEEEDEDDESSKQLSPVSVLEQRPFKQGPPAYAQKAVFIFQELLVAAYTPALLDQLSIDSSSTTTKSRDGRDDTAAATTAAPARTNRITSAAHWEETFRANIAKVHDLIASEMAGARVGPEGVRPEKRDVGADVAAAVLEALTEELAVELVGDVLC